MQFWEALQYIFTCCEKNKNKTSVSQVICTIIEAKLMKIGAKLMD